MSVTGHTILTYYECRTRGCPFEGIPYQIREAWPTRTPLLDDAPRCDAPGGCGKMRARLAGSELPDHHAADFPPAS